jgi:signal transduction histidine kinase
MQVISNLIANPIYAMPAGRTLSVSVSDLSGSDDGILLTVEDDGVGIAPKDLPRVFDAFFTTRATVGTGIGSSSQSNSSRDMEDGSASRAVAN